VRQLLMPVAIVAAEPEIASTIATWRHKKTHFNRESKAAVEELYDTRYQSGSFSLMWGVVFTACIVFPFFISAGFQTACLCSFFPPATRHTHTHTVVAVCFCGQSSSFTLLCVSLSPCCVFLWTVQLFHPVVAVCFSFILLCVSVDSPALSPCCVYLFHPAVSSCGQSSSFTLLCVSLSPCCVFLWTVQLFHPAVCFSFTLLCVSVDSPALSPCCVFLWTIQLFHPVVAVFFCGQSSSFSPFSTLIAPCFFRMPIRMGREEL